MKETQIRIRTKADPYLHDMFRSLLVYDAEEVKRDLIVKIGGRLLERWQLVRAYQEILGGRKSNKRADVVWLLAIPSRPDLGYRMIIHEIKTGRLDFDRILNKYEGEEFSISKSKDFRIVARTFTTNTPLYVWCWRKYYPEGGDIPSRFKGTCKVIPLDILLPKLEKKLKKVFEW